uniref:Uncharacterized protein n=1 Tax=Macrostomum lignano TaxID=282301 RepID=A0A1I8FLJ3_9PLAT
MTGGKSACACNYPLRPPVLRARPKKLSTETSGERNIFFTIDWQQAAQPFLAYGASGGNFKYQQAVPFHAAAREAETIKSCWLFKGRQKPESTIVTAEDIRDVESVEGPQTAGLPLDVCLRRRQISMVNVRRRAESVRTRSLFLRGALRPSQPVRVVSRDLAAGAAETVPEFDAPRITGERIGPPAFGIKARGLGVSAAAAVWRIRGNPDFAIWNWRGGARRLVDGRPPGVGNLRQQAHAD